VDLRQTKLSGVFSTQSVVKVGTGTTIRRTIQKTYWHVQELDDGAIQIQPLNQSYIPAGPKRKISRDEFLKKFTPEPEFYQTTVYPKLQELDQSISRGEKHREQGEVYAAEHQFDHAVNLDEENVRANFGLGLTYMDRGEESKAGDIFERLVKLEATFSPEHKHLFNEFGINLRKTKMFDRAIEYYRKALDVSKNEDDHLHVNLARSFFEKGDVKSAVGELKEAARINPELEEARKFWEHLRNKRLIGDPYPADKVARAERRAKAKAEVEAAKHPEEPAEEAVDQAIEQVIEMVGGQSAAPQPQASQGPRAAKQNGDKDNGRLHVRKDKQKGLGKIIVLDK